MAAHDGASSSSSSGSSFSHDVFLSFRGPDTGNSFTAFLHNYLKREGIKTYLDREDLRGGEEIKSALFKAIQGSKISIPIFSKGYADSRWCLDELVEIVRCHRENGQLILPIFFDVEPTVVRHQIGSFQVSFEKHKDDHRFDEQTINSWKEALKEVAAISGYDLGQVGGNQPKLVELVINRASSELRSNLLCVVKNAVGLDARVEELLSLLDTSSKEVRFVGICGLGGIGKTCIAAALFNRISNNFDKHIFLGNVREEASQPNGLVQLQQKLIYSASKRKEDICNVHEGSHLIKEQLHKNKVLLIIDDVDSYSQLKDLAIEFILFGPGSRIIITSRDKHILDVAKVDDDNIYWPSELNNAQSFRLFSLHAFSMEQPPEDYEQLSHDVVQQAGGLPLTLEVLGCAFCGIKDKKVWQSMLQKLKRIPHQEVQKKLRISYDNLEDDEKSIFLDAACFFNGCCKQFLINIWEAHGFDPMSAIEKLTQRCLFKFVTRSGCQVDELDFHDVELVIHDQIRDMGRGIVFEENPIEPGKRSRLWSHEEILKVLEDHMGTQMIECIHSPLRHSFSSVCLNRDDLARMSKLRVLSVYGACFEGDLSQLPPSLSYFNWWGCPLEILPANMYHKRLVHLELGMSQIRQAWTNEPQNENMRFQKLKTLVLQDCHHLSKSPVFSWFPCLELLDLRRCSNLTHLHNSIGDLKSLVHIYLEETKIEELPNSICRLSSLKSLKLQGCRSIKNLPNSIGDLKSLVELALDGMSNLKELPNSICKLRSLKNLLLNSCSSLKNLPESIGDLKSLIVLSLDKTKIGKLPESICCLSSPQFLSLSGCSSLATLPESIGDLNSLVQLDLSGTNIEELPNSICKLSSLQKLSFKSCPSLKRLPELIGDLTSLDELSLCETKIEELPNSIGSLISLKDLCLCSCSSLETLPESIGDLNSLVKLKLAGAKIAELPNSIGRLSSLEDLNLNSCSSLETLPESIGDLNSLVQLDLAGTNIEELPNSICKLSSLQKLSFKFCPSLKRLPELIGDLTSLDELSLCGTKIEELPNSIGSLISLKDLCLCSCSSLETLPESIGDLNSLVKLKLAGAKIAELPNSIGRLSSLEDLSLNSCSSLETFPESIGDLNSLVQLDLIETNIEELPNSICKLSSLQKLSFKFCPSLKRLPELIGDLTSLDELSLCGTKIEELPNSIGSLISLKDLCLCSCSSLETLPESIGDLNSLVKLKLAGAKIAELPNTIGRLSSLEDLCLISCSSLETLPESIGDLNSLVQLDLTGTNIEELPNSICKLSSLQKLSFKFCPSLKRLPELIGDLTSLEELSLCGTKIEELPNSIGSLISLKDLCLCSCSSLETLPESIGDLNSLVKLKLTRAKIAELPNTIGRLSSLEDLYLISCSSLETLPESIGDLESLVRLSLAGTKIEELPNSICMLSSLKMLDLNLCKSLQKLPESIGDLNSSVELILGESNIKELPINGDGGMLEKLEVLRVRGCSNLVNQLILWGRMKCIRIIDLIGTSILLPRDDFPMLPSLVELKIGNQLESSLPLWVSGLPQLEKLELQGYTRLESLPKLPPTLTVLEVRSCSSLLKLPDLSGLNNLRILILDDCKRLEEIGGLEGTESLEQFDVYDCDALTYTPKKMHGQGTLLVEESSRSDSLNVNDGTYKGLILCLVFSFVNKHRWSTSEGGTSEEGNEGEPPMSEGDGEPPMIQLNCTASIRQQDALTKSNIRMRIEGVEYSEGDIIYIHHFKGFDWFGLPLEGKDAIEDIKVSTVVPTEHQECISYDCEVKFWKLILKSTENEQQMLYPESSATMVADFFDWPGFQCAPTQREGMLKRMKSDSQILRSKDLIRPLKKYKRMS